MTWHLRSVDCMSEILCSCRSWNIARDGTVRVQAYLISAERKHMSLPQKTSPHLLPTTHFNGRKAIGPVYVYLSKHFDWNDLWRTCLARWLIWTLGEVIFEGQGLMSKFMATEEKYVAKVIWATSSDCVLILQIGRLACLRQKSNTF